MLDLDAAQQLARVDSERAAAEHDALARAYLMGTLRITDRDLAISWSGERILRPGWHGPIP